MKWGPLIILLLFIVACGSTEEAIQSERVEALEPIKIGVVGPFGGPIAFYGERMTDGFELALEEINNAEGVGGRPIKLLYEDDGCRSQNTVTAVRKLVDADKVVALLGPFCGSSVKAAAEFVDEKKIMLITSGDNFGNLTEYYFSTRFPIKREGEELAKFAYDNLSVRKVGIIHVNNDWGVVFGEAFTNALEGLGGEVTTVENYNYEVKDFRTHLTKIKESGADTILVLYGRGGLIFKQIRELGLNLTTLSDMGSEEPAEIEGAAGSDDGVVYMSVGDACPEFEQRFVAKYNKSSGIVNRDSYGALMILANALKECENFNTECIANYVDSFREFEVGSCSIEYDPKIGSFQREMFPKVIRNGSGVVYS